MSSKRGSAQQSATQSASQDADRKTNLILISIDTLRADRLGCYGYDRPTSPAIDALAARGARFARAVTAASWTIPSHMTIFTGLPPTAHGVTLATQKLGDDVPTLAQVLLKHGYRTQAFTAGAYVSAKYGFDHGFELFDDEEKPFATVLKRAEQAIESFSPDEPYFLFLHTFDVHCPYDPPAEYAEPFETQPPENRIDTHGKCGNPDYNHATLSPEQVQHISDRYDAGIRAADADLAQFIAFLDARHELDDTLVVLLSDHGEEFREHGRIGHGWTLFGETLMVPLVFVGPGVTPRVVEPRVSLLDVMPTVLELLSVEGPAMQGASLVPLVEGNREQWTSPLFSERDQNVELRSIIRDRYHLIVRREPEGRWLFDMEADPTEQTNLIGGRSRLAADMERELLEYYSGLTRHIAGASGDLSAEEVMQLKALGYAD